MILTSLINLQSQASVFSWVGDILTAKSFAAVGAVLMFYLGYLVKKEILPLLKAKRNREIAMHILVIADDVTDYFRLKFPKAHWSVWLDKAVDRIIEITEVKREVAGRAARAAVARKGGSSENGK